MRAAALGAALAVIGTASIARAGEVVIPIDGDVPAEGDWFELPFEVPAGTVEIEVRHDDLSEENILDWGLMSPSGFRGYGGGNTEPATINAEAATRSYLPGPIEPGTWRVYVGKARVSELPARYHVEVVLRDAVTLAPQSSREAYSPVAALRAEARWYAGDFHVHSRESGDAAPSLDEIADFAEPRGLDFVMLSEHNTVSQLEWIAEAQAAHPSLLFVPGIEVTTYEGHAMSLGGVTWIDHRMGLGDVTMEAIAGDVHADGALFSINHPSLSLGDACIGCAWEAMLDDGDVDAMEIQTGAWSVTGALFLGRTLTRWEAMAAEGHHVIALGGSDDHRAGAGTGMFDSPIGSPTTMVYADELSVAAIVEGVRLGRTVVKLEGPDDPMVEIVSPDLAGGNSLVADSVVVRVRVTGASEGGTLTIVRDGRSGPPIEVVGDPFEHEETLLAGATETFVRAELAIGGRPRVITNHFFVTPMTAGGPDGGPADAGPTAPPPTGSCACRAQAGDRATWLSLGLVGLLGLVLARLRERLHDRR